MGAYERKKSPSESNRGSDDDSDSYSDVSGSDNSSVSGSDNSSVSGSDHGGTGGGHKRKRHQSLSGEHADSEDDSEDSDDSLAEIDANSVQTNRDLTPAERINGPMVKMMEKVNFYCSV